MKLTKSAIDKATYAGRELKPGIWSRHVLWDAALPGFGIRVFPTGVKAFVVAYRTAGRQRQMTLGRYGVLTLEQARDAARDVLVRVTKGQDPLGEKQAKQKADTVKQLWQDYLELYAKQKKRSWEEDVRRFERRIPASWHQRKVESITTKDVETLHAKIGDRSAIEANRTLALLSKMFNWGKLTNPCQGIEKYPETKRDRWLTSEEIIRLRDATAAEPNIYIRAAIWLYLLTGCRKSELLNAKWTDVDLSAEAIHLRGLLSKI